MKRLTLLAVGVSTLGLSIACGNAGKTDAQQAKKMDAQQAKKVIMVEFNPILVSRGLEGDEKKEMLDSIDEMIRINSVIDEGEWALVKFNVNFDNDYGSEMDVRLRKYDSGWKVEYSLEHFNDLDLLKTYIEDTLEDMLDEKRNTSTKK